MPAKWSSYIFLLEVGLLISRSRNRNHGSGGQRTSELLDRMVPSNVKPERGREKIKIKFSPFWLIMACLLFLLNEKSGCSPPLDENRL